MTGRAARVGAQAKVNLFLRVLAREPSGYHQLETLFCRLALADLITVRTTSGERSLDAGGPAMPAGGLGPAEQNLAWRAAVAFAERSGWRGGFAIELDKRIPAGGGLGGGSSDAGAVLNAMNALSATPLAPAALQEIAASLGADVPFLTGAHTLALASGRGELILPLPSLPARPVLLVAFPFGVATGDAYRWLAESRAGEPGPKPRAVNPGSLRSWEAITTLATNDFETVVPAKAPDIGRALASLRAAQSEDAASGISMVLLCGSGATVMAIGAAGWRPESAAARLEGIEGVRLIVTSTASRVEEVQVFE